MLLKVENRNFPVRLVSNMSENFDTSLLVYNCSFVMHFLYRSTLGSATSETPPYELYYFLCCSEVTHCFCV